MVSTLDSESSDPSSSLGGTWHLILLTCSPIASKIIFSTQDSGATFVSQRQYWIFRGGTAMLSKCLDIFRWICGFPNMWDFLSMVLLHVVQSKFTSIQGHHNGYCR